MGPCKRQYLRRYGDREAREPGAPHRRPHFHAYHQDQVSVFAIEPVELIRGGLPNKETRLVLAWAEIHRQGLLDNWDTLQAGRLPSKIEPLR